MDIRNRADTTPGRQERAAAVQAIRHFNRYYTNRLGLLGRYRFDTRLTLTEARVILEIGRRGQYTQTALRAGLKIDPGYLSRVIKGLVADGLISSTKVNRDGRLLVLELTEAGRSRLGEIEVKSNAEAEELMEGLGEGETRRLVDHLRGAEAILERGAGTRSLVTTAEGASDLATIRVLMREYVDFLGVDLSFQDFEAELSTLPGKYAPPGGALFLARVSSVTAETKPAGCVALRALAPGICEMKRLFVRPEYRGLGIGRALAERVVQAGRNLGYAAMRLDTLERLEGAVGLYRSMGFVPTAPYCANPLPGASFWEKDLKGKQEGDPMLLQKP